MKLNELLDSAIMEGIPELDIDASPKRSKNKNDEPVVKMARAAPVKPRQPVFKSKAKK